MMSSMQRGGVNLVNTEQFFSKIISAEKGITFNMKGEPLLYKKPKVKDTSSLVDY